MPPTFLMPTRSERVTRMRSDLAMGLPCILTEGATSVLMAPLETISGDRFAALQHVYGAPELVLSPQRARAVMRASAAENLGPGPVRIRPPEKSDFAWFQRVADPGHDRQSGPLGPLHVVRDEAPGCADAGLALIKSAQLVPAFCLFALSPGSAAGSHMDLAELGAADVTQVLGQSPALAPVAAAHLPMDVHSAGKLHIYRDPDGAQEHYAIVIGNPNPDAPVLTRLHSACFTGDVLGSRKCDCGPQLRAALARMGEEGAGVLLYLNQEGRGIGLANKMRVYTLQEQGWDTVEANHRLGFEDDERDFRIAATLLNQTGLTQIRLLTNNPAKVTTLADHGIQVVERLPLRVGRTEQNNGYLAAKALKSGHLL